MNTCITYPIPDSTNPINTDNVNSSTLLCAITPLILHNNPPLLTLVFFLTLFCLFVVRLFICTFSPAHFLALHLKSTFVIVATAFVAVKTLIVATIFDAFKHASKALMTFALLLFLSLAGIVLVAFWVVFIVLSGFELSFTLCETECELPASTRRWDLKRWRGFGLVLC
jgi:hypothetical protein